MKIWFGIFVALMFFSALAAASSTGSVNITSSFSQLCTQIKTAVPIIAFTMMILGGIIYGAGQVMGAETRARANVWATAMLTGGIIGLLIAAGAPYLMGFFISMFTTSGISASWAC